MSVRKTHSSRKTQKKKIFSQTKRTNDPHEEITNYMDESHKTDLSEKRLASRLHDIFKHNPALVNSTDSLAHEPLLARASYYNLERVVALLLGKSNIKVNDIGKNGVHTNHPALVYAIRQGNDEVAMMLLDHPKIDVMTTGDHHGENILMIACFYNRVDVVRHLLEVNADFDVIVKGKKVKYINFQDHHGWTALMHATNSGYVEIVRLILNYGASHNYDLKSNLISLHTEETAKSIAISMSQHDDYGDTPENFYRIEEMITEYDVNFEKRVIDTIKLSLRVKPRTIYDTNNKILSYITGISPEK